VVDRTISCCSRGPIRVWIRIKTSM
jgi:hypothetical protein